MGCVNCEACMAGQNTIRATFLAVSATIVSAEASNAINNGKKPGQNLLEILIRLRSGRKSNVMRNCVPERLRR